MGLDNKVKVELEAKNKDILKHSLAGIHLSFFSRGRRMQQIKKVKTKKERRKKNITPVTQKQTPRIPTFLLKKQLHSLPIFSFIGILFKEIALLAVHGPAPSPTHVFETPQALL